MCCDAVCYINQPTKCFCMRGDGKLKSEKCEKRKVEANTHTHKYTNREKETHIRTYSQLIHIPH